MKRATLLLVGLGLVLVLVAWYLLIFSPSSDELAQVETEIVDVQAQQATTRSRIATLEGIREQAPQLQAELAAAESLLPRDTALPTALRQLQRAADESNATLVSVAPSRPEPIEGAAPELYAMGLNAEVRGTYFQIVDVLRRLEDPAISPRGILWEAAGLTIDDTAPDLVAILTGEMFAVLPAPPAPEAATPAPGADAEASGDTDADAEATDDTEADAEVDVDVDVEEGDQ